MEALAVLQPSFVMGQQLLQGLFPHKGQDIEQALVEFPITGKQEKVQMEDLLSLQVLMDQELVVEDMPLIVVMLREVMEVVEEMPLLELEVMHATLELGEQLV